MNKTGRAWNNKLSNIGKLVSWLYDRDILTKSDKDKKDQVFRAYYRYYNDGDFPRALSRLGYSKYSPEGVVDAALEEYLNDCIRAILTKYKSRYDRTEFRRDAMLTKLKLLNYALTTDNKSVASVQCFTKDISYNVSKCPGYTELLVELKSVEDRMRSEMDKTNTLYIDCYVRDSLIDFTPELVARRSEIYTELASCIAPLVKQYT